MPFFSLPILLINVYGLQFLRNLKKILVSSKRYPVCGFISRGNIEETVLKSFKKFDYGFRSRHLTNSLYALIVDIF